MRDNMSGEVKSLVREVLERMVAPLLAAAEHEAMGGSSSSGGAAAGGHGRSGSGLPLPPAIHPAQQEAEMAERLAALPHAGFMQVRARGPGGWLKT